jgi:WD40 repeat protein
MICTCSHDSTIKIWDVTKGTELGNLRGQGGRVESVCWSPDGEKVAASSQDDRSCTIWDVTSFTLVRTLRDVDLQSDACQTDHAISGLQLDANFLTSSCCSWISCSHIAASIDSSKIFVWDSSTGAVIATMLGHSGIVRSLKFCLSRNLLASGSVDTCIRIWCSQRRTQHVTLHGHAGSVDALDWTIRGDRLASASVDESIIIWDCHAWTQLVSLKRQWTGLRSVAFSPAGDQLANVGNDGLLFIWDASTYQVIATLRGKGVGGSTVQYSPLGTRLANGYHDGYVVIWDRELVLNSMTHSECDAAETKPESRTVWSLKEPSVSRGKVKCTLAEAAHPADITTSTHQVTTHTHMHTQSTSGEEPFRAGQPVSNISEQCQDKGKDDQYQTVASSDILSSIVIHCHELSQGEASTLVGSLTLRSSTLTGLSLFGLQASQEELFLQDYILNLTQLRSMSIINGTFESGSASFKPRVAKVMERLGSLQDLDLERNNLGPTGATGIAVPLTHLSLLRRLRLGHNNMEDSGSKAIATSIRQHSLLTELNLEDNLLTPEGVTAIINTLAPLTALHKLAFKDSLLAKSCLDPAHLARCVSNVEISMIPQSITDAFHPAGVPEMRLKHGITGNMPHSLAISFEMDTHDLDSGKPAYLGRRWLAWMGRCGIGSAHWIFTDRYVLCVCVTKNCVCACVCASVTCVPESVSEFVPVCLCVCVHVRVYVCVREGGREREREHEGDSETKWGVSPGDRQRIII